MNNCIKDLIDYNLVERCCRCKSICLKSNFWKNKKMSDGLQSQSIFCVNDFIKNYYVANQDRLLNKQNLYDKENRDKINTRMNENVKNRIKADVNFRLIRNTRRRIHQALQVKTRSSSTKDILGIDIDTFRKWLEIQFTPEMNGKNTEIDHVKAMC